MRGTNQGGSLAGFIIIGVLLTLVLVGGLYGLNRYNAEKAGVEVATEEQAGTEEAAPGAATDRERTAAEQERSSTPSADAPRTTASDPGDATPAPAPAPDTELPQTGPTEALYGILVVSLVTFVAAHYVRSRSARA